MTMKIRHVSVVCDWSEHRIRILPRNGENEERRGKSRVARN